MKSIRWYHAEIEYQTKASNHRCHHFVGQLDLNASISQLTDFVSPIARILSARNARQTREYIIFTRGHPLTVASSLEIFSFNSITFSKQFGPIGVYCFKPGNSIRLYITFPSFPNRSTLFQYPPHKNCESTQFTTKEFISRRTQRRFFKQDYGIFPSWPPQRPMIKRGEIRFRKEGYITHWESNPGLGKVVLLFAFITRAIQVFLYQPTKKTTTTKKSSGFV